MSKRKMPQRLQDIDALHIAASSESSTDSARVENHWSELLPRMTVERVTGDHIDVWRSGNAQAAVNIIEEWHTSRLGQRKPAMPVSHSLN